MLSFTWQGWKYIVHQLDHSCYRLQVRYECAGDGVEEMYEDVARNI